MALRDITLCENIQVRGYDLQVSGIIYPGERGSDRPGAPGTNDVADEIEIEEIRCGVCTIQERPELITEIKAALIAKWEKEEEY